MICVDCSTDYIDGPMASIFSPETLGHELNASNCPNCLVGDL